MHDAHDARLAAFHLFHKLRVRPFFNGPPHGAGKFRFIRHAHHFICLHAGIPHEHFIAQGLEGFCYMRRGAKFRPGKFRVGVKITPAGHQLLFHLHGFIIYRHGSPPPPP